MSIQTQTFSEETHTQQRHWLLYLGLGVVTLWGAFLLLHRLDVYPLLWTDESAYLQIAKNFAFEGVYAESSSEGWRYAGGVIGSGPTLILPVALLYQWFGVSIVTARLFVVFTGIISLAAFFGLAQRLTNTRVALLSTGLMFISPRLAFIETTRNAIGEVPGLMFVLLALWLWLRSTQQYRLSTLAGVGVLFGLACVTKNQYALFILPSILLAWFADLLWYKQLGWRYFVVPGSIAGVFFAGWTFYVFFVLGAAGRGVEGDISTVQSTSATAFFVFNTHTLQAAFNVLRSSALYGAFVFPAMLYGLLLCFRRDETGQRWGILFIFTLLGLVMFAFSLAWARYAFVPLVLISLFIAQMLYDWTDGYRLDLVSIREAIDGKPSAVGMVFLIGSLLLLVAWPIAQRTHVVLSDGSSDAYETADYLNKNVAADALIETWEFELSVLTDHTYHFPPQPVMTALVAEENLGGPPVHDAYDFREYVQPDYLIIGEFGRRAKLYTDYRLVDFELIEEIGRFKIYRRIAAGA